jgi:photosystem II stability/assembly factor-like uncharacterized protein
MHNQSIYYCALGLFFSCLIIGCAVDDFNYVSEMHQLPTDLELTDVCFVNSDTGFVSAGGIFTKGLLFGTKDGGMTWDTVLEKGQGVNSIAYHNGILSVSESGNKFHYTTDFTNWGITYAGTGWWDWKEHVRLLNGRIVLIGGKSFGRGIIHAKDLSQNTIQLTDTFNHELRDIELTTDGTLHVVGYGLVMKSTDNGDSWSISNLGGDFFRGVDFPTSNVGYVVGEYGSVYKTTDGGDSWSQIRGANSIFAAPNKLLRDIAFVDENRGFLVGTSNIAYSTTDGGKIWKEIQTFDGYTDFSSIVIHHQKAYLIGNQGKLLIVDL